MKNSNLLMIGEVKYDLDKVLIIGATGPIIIIKESELNDISTLENKPKIISSETFDDSGPVIFYKQQGKYTVLLGSKSINIRGGKLKGHLISSVALKRAKILDEVSEPASEQYDSRNVRSMGRSLGWKRKLA